MLAVCVKYGVPTFVCVYSVKVYVMLRSTASHMLSALLCSSPYG